MCERAREREGRPCILRRWGRQTATVGRAQARARRRPHRRRARALQEHPCALRSPCCSQVRSLFFTSTHRCDFNPERTSVPVVSWKPSSAFEKKDVRPRQGQEDRATKQNGVSGAAAALRAVSAAQGRVSSRRDPGHRLPGPGGERAGETFRRKRRRLDNRSAPRLRRPPAKQGGPRRRTRLTPFASHATSIVTAAQTTIHKKTQAFTAVLRGAGVVEELLEPLWPVYVSVESIFDVCCACRRFFFVFACA